MSVANLEERNTRQLLCELAASLFMRGFSVGSAGNISARLADGYLMTPTNSSLGRTRSRATVETGPGISPR